MHIRSPFLLLGLSLAAAAVCVRLGVWQLDRLAQRRARNAVTVEHLALSSIDLATGIPSGDTLAYRRVNGSGRFDFAHEVALGSRAREGNPGVHIATPLLLAGHDTAVLVLRGWVYSANASTIDFARSHEPEDVRLSGYLVAFDTATARRIPSDSNRTVYDLNRALLERRVGKPLAPYFIMMTHGGATGDSAPARMTEPRLDEGPHLSYAVQWFLFATIFGAGGTVVVLRSRSRKNT